jgi:phytoene synthase
MTSTIISAEWATDVAPPPRPSEWDAYLGSHGRSFWMAARMIPASQRAQLAGVYAYCRYTDDLVDNATVSGEELLRVLDRWEGLSRDAYLGRQTGVELLDVVMREMATAGVPFKYAEGLIRGMRVDAVGARFQTLSELQQYCHDVASVVGLWLTELFGVRDSWMLERASRLGVAMQLTNIARDVGEDWDRGRLYLPESMLRAHGVTREMIGALRRGTAPVPRSFAALLEELMLVADEAYEEGGEAIRYLPGFFRPAVAVASRVYRGIHGAIRMNDYDCIRKRAVTSDAAKVALAREALATLELPPTTDN